MTFIHNISHTNIQNPDPVTLVLVYITKMFLYLDICRLLSDHQTALEIKSVGVKNKTVYNVFETFDPRVTQNTRTSNKFVFFKITVI